MQTFLKVWSSRYVPSCHDCCCYRNRGCRVTVVESLKLRHERVVDLPLMDICVCAEGKWVMSTNDLILSLEILFVYSFEIYMPINRLVRNLPLRMEDKAKASCTWISLWASVCAHCMGNPLPLPPITEFYILWVPGSLRKWKSLLAHYLAHCRYLMQVFTD